MGAANECRVVPQLVPLKQQVTAHGGFDPTAVLHELRQGSLLHPDAPGSITSQYDLQDLIAAARAELRRSQHNQMAQADKAGLAEQVLETDEGVNFADKMAALRSAAGAELTTVTLEYRDVCVQAMAVVGSASIRTLGNVSMGLLRKAACQAGPKTQCVDILKNVSGVLRPGTVTLLLGPPGAGKSVFLQTLAGRLRQGPGVKITGDIKYNGKTQDEFVVRRTVALVDQLDYHIPSLTVLETCQFAFGCQTDMEAAAHFMALLDQLAEELEREAALVDLEKEEAAEAGQASTDKLAASEKGSGGKVARARSVRYVRNAAGKNVPLDADFVAQMRALVKQRAKPYVILKVLGLSDVADTVVGDSMTRGISGGQRKRVTTGEILCGPQAVVLMDEISTGLDSATTYSVVKSFLHTAHAMQRTFVISLLQPPPEVVQLFDDILLLTDGHVVYHGPVAEILPFFADQLGYVCPVRKDSGSFLQEVTTPVGQYAYASPALLQKKGLCQADCDPMKLLTEPPKTLLTSVEDMERVFWKESQHGRDMLEALDQRPFKPEDGSPGALYTQRYASSAARLTRLVLKRQFLLNKRDRAFYIARTLQACLMGLIIASLFVYIDPTLQEGRQVMSLASLACQMMAMMSQPQIGLVFANKRVFYKQRDNHFFPPASYVVGFVLTQLPVSTVECVLYCSIVYWITGLYRAAGQFFSFLCVVWSLSNCMAAFYRLIAYSVPSMVVGNAVGGISLLFFMITNGFSIVAGSIPPYLIWVYWINPLAWGTRALVTNELSSPKWDIPSGTPGLTMGQAAADSFDFRLGTGWIWGSVGLSWGWLLVFTAAGALALAWTHPATPKPTVSEEEQKEEVTRSVFSQLGLPTVTLPYCAAAAPAAPAAATAPLDPAMSDLSSVVSGEAGGNPAPRAKAATVPFTPITLVCRNIRYFVPDSSSGRAPGVVKDSDDKEIAGKLELLKGINLYAEPGSLTALMGGSGAGKTTLMDVILGRKTVGLIRGEVLVNGHPKQQATWSRVCGYVEQQDIHSAGTTVREALLFSARLRLEESIGWPQVVGLVDDTLEMVDLVGLQAAIVGEPGGEGLSVEQRKRLSIAVELVANPSVVFMDEPTSGLDARAAAIVMRAVKNVSLSNRTVMVTIHQPSMDIFESFSDLVLLQKGGRLTYFGPLGAESSNLVAYLQAQPDVEPIRPGYNPATWMLEVTGGSMSTTFKSSDHDFPKLYEGSELRRQNEARMEELAEQGRTTSEPLALSGTYATSKSMQSKMLIRKFFMLYWRNPDYNFLRFSMTMVIGLVLGLVYLNQGKLDESGTSVSTVQNLMGLVFMLTVFQGMFNCMTVQPTMAAERTVFYRERASAYYAPGPYSLATGIVELPYLAVQAVIMVCITYWMVGMQALAWKFFYFLLMYFLCLTMFTYFGQSLVFCTPNQLLAQLLAGFLNQIFSVFAGFSIPYPIMPAAWQWMNRLSPTTWMLYGLVGSQLTDRDIPIEGYGDTTTVSKFMEVNFGYYNYMVWWCVLIVLAYCVFFRTLSVIMLAKVNFQRR